MQRNNVVDIFSRMYCQISARSSKGGEERELFSPLLAALYCATAPGAVFPDLAMEAVGKTQDINRFFGAGFLFSSRRAPPKARHQNHVVSACFRPSFFANIIGMFSRCTRRMINPHRLQVLCTSSSRLRNSVHDRGTRHISRFQPLSTCSSRKRQRAPVKALLRQVA